MKSSIIFWLLIIFSFGLKAQNIDCNAFLQSDKYNRLYCSDCENLSNYSYISYHSSKQKFTCILPQGYKIADFENDNKILVYDSLASKTYKTVGFTRIESRITRSLDAFFLEYINSFVDNFVLSENQFFNYNEFYSERYKGKYFYKTYNQDNQMLFELSVFFYKRPNIYVITFTGKQSDYYDLMCLYLPIAYSFQFDE